MARKAFAGHDRVWVAGEHESTFVKLLVQYWNGEGRALSSGPADLRRYRAAYARELIARGILAQATTRGSRELGFGETRNDDMPVDRNPAGPRPRAGLRSEGD